MKFKNIKFYFFKNFKFCDYYSILGVKKNSSREDIKSSYYKLAKKYHPDLNNGNSEKYLKIQNAYNQIMKDNVKEKDEEYDIEELLNKIRVKSINTLYRYEER